MRNDVLGKPRPECPAFIDYTAQNGMKSVYNTPCVWAVYILNLVLKWVEKQGGVASKHSPVRHLQPNYAYACIILLL